MNSIKSKKIIFFISVVIVITIGLQFFWNYKNYIVNKDHFKNEVQTAYDKAIDIYFSEKSKKDIISLVSSDPQLTSSDFVKKVLFHIDQHIPDSIRKKYIDPIVNNEKQNSSVSSNSSIVIIDEEDPFSKIENPETPILELDINKTKNTVSNRILFTFISEKIDYKLLDSILNTEFKRKKIEVNHQIKHLKNRKKTKIFPNNNKLEGKTHNITTKSAFLKENEELLLEYSFSSMTIFQRMGIELLLTFIFILIIIFILFFMLFIINRQKKIDEIKNDFINNITHEFKTPITTISSALEGMSNFNPTNDIEKNKKYINISKDQLTKLENMVEKILETAKLTTDELELKHETFLLSNFLQIIIDKYQSLTEKKLSFSNKNSSILITADPFYLENVFSNLIDNAIKYGGNKITVSINQEDNYVIIDISDNGFGISKNEEKAIFEKFYRIPNGDIHNVKGYGIGLYFAKKIIEKHLGSLTLIRNKNTTFRTILPYEQ